MRHCASLTAGRPQKDYRGPAIQARRASTCTSVITRTSPTSSDLNFHNTGTTIFTINPCTLLSKCNPFKEIDYFPITCPLKKTVTKSTPPPALIVYFYLYSVLVSIAIART